mgnify:CR=1 FL=1
MNDRTALLVRFERWGSGVVRGDPDAGGLEGRDDGVPMCGVPHHAARGYIAAIERHRCTWLTSVPTMLAVTLPHANNEARNKGMEIPDHGSYAERDWPEDLARAMPRYTVERARLLRNGMQEYLFQL